VAAAAIHLTTLRLIGRLEKGPNPAGDPTLFTQFVPYIGFFILGYALRDFIVRGRLRIALLAVVTMALCLEPAWQLTGPFVFGPYTADHLNLLTPVSYQGWILGLASVAVFVLARSVIHPQSRWAQPRAARWARTAGDLTLGVYATHLMLMIMLRRIPGHNLPVGATTMEQLVVLCTATVLGAFVLTMVLQRIPLLRRTV
jgi:surface polysaccharide O-acyltransferase-like enzyme